MFRSLEKSQQLTPVTRNVTVLVLGPIMVLDWCFRAHLIRVFVTSKMGIYPQVMMFMLTIPLLQEPL